MRLEAGGNTNRRDARGVKMNDESGGMNSSISAVDFVCANIVIDDFARP